MLEAYGKLHRYCELMWQHHSEFLLLGYGAYATFVDFCKNALPDIPDQHIAQMVAGIDVLLFRPDAELKRLARLAIDTGIDSAFVQGRSQQEIDDELAQSDAGKAWLEELEKVKDPWFNMATGDGLYHYYGSWLDDPSIPYASLIGYVSALTNGEEIERPTEELPERRTARRGSAARRGDAQGFDELLGLSRMVFPYVEEHKFLCDYWFLTRWWNKVREFGRSSPSARYLEDSEDIFQLSRTEVQSALDELVLVWATGGEPLGPKHWPPIAARPRTFSSGSRLDAPPAIGAMPEEVNDPVLNMLWGITTERVRAWAQSQDGGPELNGGRVAGRRRGTARVVKTVQEISDVRDGEILVCSITSPAWAPIFTKVGAVVTDIGGVMSHAAIVCREVRAPGCRRDRAGDVSDQDGPDDPRRRVVGRRDDPRLTTRLSGRGSARARR